MANSQQTTTSTVTIISWKQWIPIECGWHVCVCVWSVFLPLHLTMPKEIAYNGQKPRHEEIKRNYDSRFIYQIRTTGCDQLLSFSLSLSNTLCIRISSVISCNGWVTEANDVNFILFPLAILRLMLKMTMMTTKIMSKSSKRSDILLFCVFSHCRSVVSFFMRYRCLAVDVAFRKWWFLLNSTLQVSC